MTCRKRRCRDGALTKLTAIVSRQTRARFQQIAKSLGKDLHDSRQSSEVMGKLIHECLVPSEYLRWRMPDWVWGDDQEEIDGIYLTQMIRLYQREH